MSRRTRRWTYLAQNGYKTAKASGKPQTLEELIEAVDRSRLPDDVHVEKIMLRRLTEGAFDLITLSEGDKAVNGDVVTFSAAGGPPSDEMLTLAALYAPLDGMNEKGLCVSVNTIQDSAAISQDTDKPDITTTTAVRLLLNRAATVGGRRSCWGSMTCTPP